MNRKKGSLANKIGKKGVFLILIALIMLLILTYPITAQVPLPAGYYGSLEIDGIDALKGTTIIAKIDGEVRCRPLITDVTGKYGSHQEPLLVTGYEHENNTAIVTFYADGRICSPTVIMGEGNIERVDLTFSVPTPTPTPTPTLTPSSEGSGGDGGGVFLPSPSPISTPVPTVTPSPTQTPTPIITPSATPTQTSSPTIPPAPRPVIRWFIIMIAIVASAVFISAFYYYHRRMQREK